jgi:hypothetical protein
MNTEQLTTTILRFRDVPILCGPGGQGKSISEKILNWIDSESPWDQNDIPN